MKVTSNQTKAFGRKLSAASGLALILVLSFVLSACASAAAPTAEVAAPEVSSETAVAVEATSAPADAAAVSGATAEPLKIKIGVSPAPHGDIIKFIQENLAAEAGLEIEIVEFTDYVQPNLALAQGEIDVNYFQHAPYLDDFNAEHNLELVPVVAVHIEPLGIYSSKISALDEIADGAVVAIPNDATNGGRALNLLAANGLITLPEDASFTATVNDIVDNPKNLDIVELEAAQLVRSLEDTTIAVINGNYALEGGLNPSADALALESGEDNPYANILVANKGHENDENVQLLAKLLTSSEVMQFIEEKYSGSVIPAF